MKRRRREVQRLLERCASANAAAAARGEPPTDFTRGIKAFKSTHAYGPCYSTLGVRAALRLGGPGRNPGGGGEGEDTRAADFPFGEEDAPIAEAETETKASPPEEEEPSTDLRRGHQSTQTSPTVQSRHDDVGHRSHPPMLEGEARNPATYLGSCDR